MLPNNGNNGIETKDFCLFMHFRNIYPGEQAHG